MHNKDEKVTKNDEKVTHYKKITMRIPVELHQDFLHLIVDKHKTVYGHYNQEVITSMKEHIKNEKKKRK